MTDGKKCGKTEMKLYVWTEFDPDYTGGLAFAIAKDETQAQKKVRKAYYGEPYSWGTLKVYRIDRAIAYAVGGGS